MEKETNEMVSVVISTYNGAGYIEEQFDSILHQTYTNLEIIIIDDASTDDTYSILESYAAKDRRISLYKQQKNVGYNISFSEACSKATGAFIAVSDQDDIWELDKIEKQLKKITEDPMNVLVHCISARFEEKSKPHLRSIKRLNFFRGSDIKSFYLHNYISGHTILFRQSLLKSALPFPPNVYYDWWLVAYACTIGKIEFEDEILVWHRIHESNATGAAKPKMLFVDQTKLILPIILTIRNISTHDYEFGKELLKRYRDFERGFSWSLFWFLLKNAKTVFAHKKRMFAWASYVKHSFKYSRYSTVV